MHEEYAALHAASGQIPADAERRSALRFRTLRRCTVRPADSPSRSGWKAIAYDLSAAGIGLALPYPLAVSTALVVEPRGFASRPLEARVLRVSPVSHLWFCGCELATRIGEAELRLWLRDAPSYEVGAAASSWR